MYPFLQPVVGIRQTPGPNSLSNRKQPILRVENLQVRAGSQSILRDINLEVPRSQITVLLGPSGW
ncbi:MAG: hypothetical protein R2751_08705 [Bacteroidales bacterium]